VIQGVDIANNNGKHTPTTGDLLEADLDELAFNKCMEYRLIVRMLM